MSDRLAIVVPCYNEEEVLPISIPELLKVLEDLAGKQKIDRDSYLLFVNDGSRDRTWELLEEAHRKDARVCAVKLAKNCGHQSALIAGLMTVRENADMTVSIDADLQDDVSVIEDMVDAYHNGCEIVYGIRGSRKSDSFFKRTTAQGFYKFLAALGVKTVYNHADFRLMSSKALAELAQYHETNLYLRGLIPLLGLKTGEVFYERKERLAGESKYPFKKMLALAMNGITSFSVQPIRLVFQVGLFVLLICLCAAVYAFVSYLSGSVEHGWTSIILSIWFLGGVQLLAIGVIGEYIGKIYNEVKHRPLYHIETVLQSDTE
ncbi:MAG: glycosyltransferase family 2 protein [Lachnospiraceae bacterium]|nr:glycosyltransferase family 2 protein [Lachnospiraceae bacterium]